MTKTQCDYDGCSIESQVKRLTEPSGIEMNYCATHDPLTDERVKECFVTPLEVEGL